MKTTVRHLLAQIDAALALADQPSLRDAERVSILRAALLAQRASLDGMVHPTGQHGLHQAGQPWDPEQEALLQDRVRAGVPLKAISRELGRSRAAIAARLKRLEDGPSTPDLGPGSRWIDEHETIVRDRWGAGATLETIGGELGRSPGAVAARLSHLGVASKEAIWESNLERGGGYGREALARFHERKRNSSWAEDGDALQRDVRTGATGGSAS
ncbi:MAG: hypothetical protein HKL99_10800 [Burkholderiales bacterium]|nr:hypothetical protein [Burkholderiales bacterium]